MLGSGRPSSVPIKVILSDNCGQSYKHYTMVNIFYRVAILAILNDYDSRVVFFCTYSVYEIDP